jgi:hypothetical protein
MEAILAMAEEFIRPSAMPQIASCAGSAILQAATVLQRGRTAPSDVADIGTAVHYRVQRGVGYWLFGDEWGEAIAKTCNDAVKEGMDPWSVHCVQITLEFYRDLIDQYAIEKENVLVEHRLDMERFGFRNRHGTADLVLVIPFRLVIIVDLKAGFLDQGEASEHDQLSVYAMAGAATFKAKEVQAIIFQPRAERLNRASAATFDAAALASTAGWCQQITSDARNPEAELTPSYKACTYCKALTTCPAAREYAMKVKDILEDPIGPTTPDEWGDFISRAKVAEKLGEGGVDQGKTHLRAGGTATGWQMVPQVKTSLPTRPVIEDAIKNQYLGTIIPALKVGITELKKCIGKKQVDERFASVMETTETDMLKPDRAGNGN